MHGNTLSRVLRVVAVLGLAAGAISTYADVDLWGHVRFGLDILSSGHLAAGADPYSFTADTPFVYHEWLGGVIMAIAYRAAGVAGLMILKALLAVAIVLTVWHALRPLQPAWRWAGAALAAWGALPLELTLRPQLWTGLLLVIVCRVLTMQSRRAVWALPPLFALWANLHGGWIVGGAVVALWTAGAIVERHPNRWPLLAAGAVSFAATLLNPYGIGLWTFLLATVRLGREQIVEWEPIWRAGAPFVLLWSLTVVAVLVSLRRYRGIPLGVIAALGGLAVAAARVNRVGPLFVLAALTLLARYWPRADSPATTEADPYAVLDGVAAAAVVALIWFNGMPHCLSYRNVATTDAAAAESLRGTHGRLVTFFDWGEYAIWHFGPALKVSIDARRETLYSARTLDEQFGIWRGDAAGLSALARIAPDYVWLPVQSRAASDWLRHHGYREDVRTDRSFIAVRNDLPPLRAWQGAASQCFPGP